MKTFCYTTMFDTGYGPKGLSLLESAVRQAEAGVPGIPVQGFVLALDDKVAEFIRAHAKELNVGYCQSLEQAMLIPGIGERLRKAKADRTYQEFCWSLASLWTDHVMEGFFRDELLFYLDADVFFFDTPRRLVDEMEGKSIGLQPHAHIASQVERLSRNGYYNIGTVAFRANEVGKAALHWWAENVLDWCHYTEGDRSKYQYCGDQGYADGIAAKWKSHVYEFGETVTTAPWNILHQHVVTDGPSVNGQRMINYHFHEFKDRTLISNYTIQMEAERLIYKPYIESTERWKKALA